MELAEALEEATRLSEAEEWSGQEEVELVRWVHAGGLAALLRELKEWQEFTDGRCDACAGVITFHTCT